MALIHHPALKVDANVPERTVPIWLDQGWREGPGPWTESIDVGFPPPGYDPYADESDESGEPQHNTED